VTAVIRLGTQGWNYPAWVGPFYPLGTRPSEMLALYTRAFPTVEIDATFYAIPAEPVVRGWRARVPPEFVFSLKVPQEITHELRLLEAGDALGRFLARARLLEGTLGPLLLQTPADWTPTADARAALADFLPLLPADLRWVIEFRNPRWLTDATLSVLRAHGVAVALVEGRWLKRERVLALAAEPTADFAYVRWMGPDRSLTDYSRVQVARDREIGAWGEAIAALRSRVREVFGYVNNHFEGHSPATARTLQARLGLRVVDPSSLRIQGELF
jgi:uncharacterized protein YecE (DUF72 family)